MSSSEVPILVSPTVASPAVELLSIAIGSLMLNPELHGGNVTRAVKLSSYKRIWNVYEPASFISSIISSDTVSITVLFSIFDTSENIEVADGRFIISCAYVFSITVNLL